MCSNSAAVVPQSKSTEWCSSSAAVVPHRVNLPSCVVTQRLLCHKVSLPRSEARQRLFFLTCDIFGTGQTNILALCYLFGKTYKPAHSSAPQVTEINKLDQITEKVVDVSTDIPLKALMIHLKRVKLRSVV